MSSQQNPLNAGLVEGPKASAEHESARARKAWLLMSLCFAFNHATVTTPIGYATSVLKEDIGSYTNAMLYGVTLFAALFLAPLVNSNLGAKTGLLLGMGGYVIYVLCFASATLFCNEENEKGKCMDAGVWQWIFAFGGALIGGLGAGVLWTCQGAYLGLASAAVSEGEGKPAELVNSDLAGSFAFWYLLIECIAKAAMTGLQMLNVSTTASFYVYSAVAAIATAMFMVLPGIPQRAVPAGASPCSKAIAALRLWPDPKIWLLSFTNLTFGFSVAWLNGYVNANYESAALESVLGDNASSFIGFLGAMIALIAGLSSKLFSLAGKTGKLFVVLFGSICFLLVGALSQVNAPDGKGPGGWGWGILVFYVLQGLGRGVYESTNKGIFADYFPGEKAVGAFANCMCQSVAASCFGFIVGAGAAKGKPPVIEIWLLIICAVCTFPALILTGVIHRRQTQGVESNALEREA